MGDREGQSQCLLALDGGGTKTHLVLYKPGTGELYAFGCGCTNHEILPGGMPALRARLGELLRAALSRAGVPPERVGPAVLGMAGLDTKSQFSTVEGFLREWGLRRFLLCNDAYLGLRAGISGRAGICLVGGTGYNVSGLDPGGRMFQAGGQFELTGDFGGGLLLGKEAVKTVYLNLFRHHRDTALNRLVMELYGVTSKYDLMDRVCALDRTGELRIPYAAKCVFDAANLGDPQSVHMLERMAEEYVLSIGTVLEELSFEQPEIEVVLVGSLFTKGWSGIHLRALEGKLRALLPEKRFLLRPLEKPPVVGALAWALEESGAPAPLDRAERLLRDVRFMPLAD